MNRRLTLVLDRSGNTSWKPESCANCRFYMQWECHRHAPTARGEHSSAEWPRTMAEFTWCGDWEKLPNRATGLDSDQPVGV